MISPNPQSSTPNSGFPPVTDRNSKILILGSMPGKDSLNAQRYYAHKRNVFWNIMGELYGAGPDIPYKERLTLLLLHNIGLWDVIGSCIRKTSLDSDIEEQSIQVNDFTSFLQDHANIKRICFNGIKAEQSFKRYVLADIDPGSMKFLRLPSTSPANARMKYQEKLKAWREALSL